ncbi:hypothetical protein HZB88_05125, partial [archaeon]|nr:hypothetical protein [archaeon]
MCGIALPASIIHVIFSRGKMQTAKVKKREGTIVDFDQSKIVEVIWKAHKSTGGGNRSLAEGLAFQVIESLEKKFKQEEILGVEQIQDAIEEVLIREEQTKIAKAFILYRQKRAEIRKAKIALGITDELKLPLNAIKVLEARYLRKDETGKVIETTAQLFQRVANVIASVESRYGKTDEEAKEKSRLFYEMMVKQEFLPNSPTLMNAGAGGLGMLSACFVLPVPDSIEGIFDAIKYTALIHRCGGGTGFSFSRLRPRGDIVRSTSGIASGPISFMKIFDCATEQIKQGGKRRGANMGVLRVDHPDILDFIVFKEKEGVLSNFNISVAITDKFMKAVMNDGYYDLINPKNGKVVSKMRARAVWNLIITMAWKTGDPGILFIDRINNSFSNPVPSLGPIESTNPCITSDTWIMTSDGAKQVKELIGKRFTAIVNSEKSETDKGFFLTGKKPVYKLITKEGFEVRLTADHPVLKAKKISRNTTKTEWAKVSDLNKGEKIALNVHRNFNGWEGSYGEEEGYLIGLLFGDGTITRNKFILGSWGDSPGPMNVRDITQQIAFNFSHRSDFAGWGQIGDSDEYRMSFGYLKKLGLGLGLKPKLKVINDCIEKTSSLFYDGFLRGMFDCDGSVQGNHLKGASIRLSQSNLDSLKAVQRMLLRRGIFSRIYQNRRKEGKRKLPDGKGGYKEYNIKAQHELVIS